MADCLAGYDRKGQGVNMEMRRHIDLLTFVETLTTHERSHAITVIERWSKGETAQTPGECRTSHLTAVLTRELTLTYTTPGRR
jgi:hypothetical protein